MLDLELQKNEHEISVAVGARLRKKRRALGVTQHELAQAIGVTFQQLQKYEKGTNRVSVPRLIQICHHLSVNPNEILAVSEGIAALTKREPFGEPDNQALRIGQAVYSIRDPIARSNLIGFIRALASDVRTSENA